MDILIERSLLLSTWLDLQSCKIQDLLLLFLLVISFILYTHELILLYLSICPNWICSMSVGISTASLDQISVDEIGSPSSNEKHDSTDPESCPFSWARSPENLLCQETYLALATAFVLLRLLYIFFPTLLVFTQCAWRRYIQNVRLGSLLEHPLTYLKRAVQLSNSLKEPCKRSNLQEGALNARAWASKSLASAVSIGDASTSRGVATSECHWPSYYCLTELDAHGGAAEYVSARKCLFKKIILHPFIRKTIQGSMFMKWRWKYFIVSWCCSNSFLLLSI